MLLISALLFAIAAISSLFLTPLVCQAAIRFGFFDRPGFRKIHANLVPRLGGVGVFASLLIAVLSVAGLRAGGVFIIPVASEFLFPLLLGGAILFVVGLWDDLWILSVGVKLFGQTVASVIPLLWGIRFEQISILGGSPVDLGVWAFPLTFLWVFLITNAWNLIDGLDGLSSGLAIIAAGTFAVLFIADGNFQPVLVLLVLIGALAGFLRYNFYPAKIFLGDSGSLPLGYALAVTAVVGLSDEKTTWSIAIPLLVLGLPILDTTLVITTRLFESLRNIRRDRKEPCLKRIGYFSRLLDADQNHIHYRLLARGFSHRSVVLIFYNFSVFLTLLALCVYILGTAGLR